jgi:hypothetical protein
MLTKKKLAILTSDDWHHKYLVNFYCKLFEVSLVVIEPSLFQRKSLLRKGKLIDYFYSKYHQFRRQITGLNKFRQRFFNCDLNLRDSLKVVVEDVNCKEVHLLLAIHKPDITIIMCTSKLSENLLKVLNYKVINIHGGYLPDYRGNHCFFFAMYHKRYDKIGSSIHFVDKTLDTGDIIEIVVPKLEKGDTPESLYCKAELAAIHRLSELLIKYDSVSMFPRHIQSFKSKLYLTRDRGPIMDITFYLRRKLLRYKFAIFIFS